MDLKGVTWVGNIYKKFETMCLEVEEVMYQDTVKYVEDQVQTVGSSVKKFYSDVMQDLLPPSPLDPVTGAVSDFPVGLYDVGIYIKPPLGMKKKKLKVDVFEPSTADSKPSSEKDSEHASATGGPFPVDNVLPLSQDDSIGGISRKYVKGTAGGIRKRKNLPRLDKSGSITPLDKDLKRATSVCELPNKNYGASLNQRHTVATLGSAEFRRNEYRNKNKPESEKPSEHISSTSTNETSSDAVNLVESGRSEGTSTRLSPAVISTMPIECSANGDSWSDTFGNEEQFVSNHERRGECGANVNEDDASNDHEMEFVEQVYEPKLDETCVMIDSDECHFVPNNGDRSKSCKKKIRDVLFLKKKSTRKQEYKQLAEAYVNDLKSGQENSGECSGSLSSPQELCESEWELL